MIATNPTMTVVLGLGLIITMGPIAMAADPPRPFTFGRPETIAENGMVASTHPQAVHVGIEILKAGGNAVDAAIATNAAMGLMEPMSCGAGGDLYALVWDARTRKLYALNASGRAPYAASIDSFKQKGLKSIPITGPLSWSVPGCVDGWDQLRAKFGTMTMAQLLEPSIKYAEEGFIVSETIAGFWHAAERTLSKSPDTTKTYLIDGHAPAKGAIFKNPNLARTYREIARGGRDAFYKGRIAGEIVKFSENNGGLFARRDFEEHTST